MRTPPRILVVDDNPTNVRILQTRLGSEGYEIVTAADGEQGLSAAYEHTPDLILLDVMMPKLSGIDVCRRLRADPAFPFTPIILVTAMADTKDVIAGLEAGGDEYLTKPVDHAALAARVRSMLRIKRLHDTVETLAAEVKEWNVALEHRVAEQVAELERVGDAQWHLRTQDHQHRADRDQRERVPKSPADTEKRRLVAVALSGNER